MIDLHAFLEYMVSANKWIIMLFGCTYAPWYIRYNETWWSYHWSSHKSHLFALDSDFYVGSQFLFFWLTMVKLALCNKMITLSITEWYKFWLSPTHGYLRYPSMLWSYYHWPERTCEQGDQKINLQQMELSGSQRLLWSKPAWFWFVLWLLCRGRRII